MPIVTILPQAQRNGTITTPSWHVPVNLVGSFRIGLTVVLADLQDTRNRITVHSYLSDDNATWRDHIGMTWEGGNYTTMHGEIIKGPFFNVDGATVAGKWLRVTMILNRPMQLGVELESL